MLQDKISYCERLGKAAKDKQTYWKPHWERVAFLCDPRYYGKVMSQPAIAQNYVGRYKYADTLMIACDRWAQAVAGLTTPETEKWQKFTFVGDTNYETAAWLDFLTDRVFARRYAMGSNFSEANYEALKLLCVYGFAVMGITRENGGIKYKTYRLTDWAIDQDNSDQINVFFNDTFEYNDADLFKRFGEAARPFFKYDECKSRQKVKTLVGENYYYIKGSPFKNRKRWFSLSWIDDKIIEEKFFDLCPLVCQRYEISPNQNDPYSLSPAMYASAAQQTLNDMIRMCLKAANNKVSPVYLGYKDNIDLSRFRPDSYIPHAMTAEGRPVVQPMALSGDIPFTTEWINYFQQQIEKALGLDLFVLFANKEKTMTATEIMQVARERAVLQNIFISKRQSQFLEKEAELNVYYGLQDNAFGDVPPEVLDMLQNKGVEMTIQYDNEISRRMRMSEIEANNLLIQTAGALANIGQQQVIDRINGDDMLKDTREILGARVQSLKSDEQVAQLAKAKQRQENAQTQAAMAAEAARLQLETAKAGLTQEQLI